MIAGGSLLPARPVEKIAETMVRKRFQQFLSWYLVLSLALAGAIALSPVLHRAIEHQGMGPLHTHSHSHQGFRTETAHHAHGHDHDSQHRHVREHAGVGGHRHTHGFFTHSHHRFTLPALDWRGLWQTIGRYFSNGDGFPSRESPLDSDEGHSHHSLPELLAAGLVDVAVDIHPLLVVPESACPRSNAASERLPSSCWNAQTPTRGPPPVVL